MANGEPEGTLPPLPSLSGGKLSITLVAAAIIEHGGRILIARRSEGQKQAGKWEFPGGKVERGETPQQCLKREIAEELGMPIEVGNFFAESVYPYETGTIKLLAYFAKPLALSYQTTVHSELLWVFPTDLGRYDVAPADVKIVSLLQKQKG